MRIDLLLPLKMSDISDPSFQLRQSGGMKSQSIVINFNLINCLIVIVHISKTSIYSSTVIHFFFEQYLFFPHVASTYAYNISQQVENEFYIYN